MQKELAEAYPGGVNTVDAIEGGMAENHVSGSDLGPLLQTIIANQNERLRDGDRFFYLNENFNQQSGLTTGEYVVTVKLPNGDKLTTPNSIEITAGGQNVTNVNFNMNPPVAADVQPTVVSDVVSSTRKEQAK